jgi:hypothetical protein
MKSIKLTFRFLFITFLFVACTKEENIIRNNNNTPKYSEVSTLMVENYINRLFIDILGREATEKERSDFVLKLRKAKLSPSSRDSIVKMLQFDTVYRLGDSSYRKAYTSRIYNICKSRFLEGAADMDIAQQSSNLGFGIYLSQLDGDSVAMYTYINLKKYYDRILKSNYWLSRKIITYNQLCEYMLNNGIYDLINMGSFNFVNATYDNIFGRKPSKDEFNRAYQIIEKNNPQFIFNRIISNKNEYCEGITSNNGFYESEIRWWYFQFVRKEINSTDLYPVLTQYLTDHSLENMQRRILITDDYAQF